MSTTRTLRVFSDGCDKYVAYDADDAARLYDETNGDPSGEEWEELPGDEKIKIDFSEEDKARGLEERTCDEWIKLNGRGFLCRAE